MVVLILVTVGEVVDDDDNVMVVLITVGDDGDDVDGG